MRKDETEAFKNNKQGSIVFSEREIQLIKLLAEGKTSKQIAVVFGLSVRTIEWYRSRLARIFNVSGGAALVIAAAKHVALHG